MVTFQLSCGNRIYQTVEILKELYFVPNIATTVQQVVKVI